MITAEKPLRDGRAVVDSRGMYLLHLRDANKPICDPGTWSIPGGDREGVASCREAVERELREETGLTVPLEEFTVVGSVSPHGTKGRIPLPTCAMPTRTT
ncbi:NUDIX domain-containing protein [Streptomyces cupreus]|uniref:NUDIX domain-containing protein n=1 Tax=Streptomyces cupreus TaxID=2759956 RepID=UPI0021B32228|nr:NUDIX domain-containing protein [Streptomyces cupreus]